MERVSPGSVVEVRRGLFGGPSGIGVVVGAASKTVLGDPRYTVDLHERSGDRPPMTVRVEVAADRLRCIRGVAGAAGLAEHLATLHEDPSRLDAITDDTALVRIAHAAVSDEVAGAAIQRVRSLGALGDLIAQYHRTGDESLARIAVDQFVNIAGSACDPDILTPEQRVWITCYASDAALRRRALDRVEGDAALCEVLNNAPDDTVRVAVERLGEEALRTMGCHHERAVVQMAARQRVAEHDSAAHLAAVPTMERQSALLGIVSDRDHGEPLRAAAAARVAALFRERGVDADVDRGVLADCLRAGISDANVRETFIAHLAHDDRISLTADTEEVDDAIAVEIAATLSVVDQLNAFRDCNTQQRGEALLALVTSQRSLMEFMEEIGDWGDGDGEYIGDRLVELITAHGLDVEARERGVEIAKDTYAPFDLRKAIVTSVDDEALLEEISGETDAAESQEDTDVALAAITRIRAPERLHRILATADDPDIVEALVSRITDPYALVCYLCDTCEDDDLHNVTLDRLKELLAPPAPQRGTA